MPVLGAKDERANASLVKWFYAGGIDEYVALTRKDMEFTRGQRDIPTTGLGVLYFSEKLRGKFTVVLAYTSGEIGNSVPRNFDEFIIALAATGEVPETAFVWKITDNQSTPVTKIITVTAKCVRFKPFSGVGGEGEVLTELDFIIIDSTVVIA